MRLGKLSCFISLTLWAAALAPSVSLLAQTQTSPGLPEQRATALSTKKKSATATKATAAKGPELEPKAVEILKATSAQLAGAQTLSFTAAETFESMSRQGVPLVYATKPEVTLQRPNKLRVLQVGDRPSSEFYYDGKMMMAYAPAENLVAVAAAPSTIDATLEKAYHSAGIYFPFTDLIVADPYGDLSPGLQHAYYVGQSKVIGGTTTDIVAVAAEGVFIQLWIGTDDKLPRAVHAIYINDPDWLRHNLVLSDWQIDPPVSDVTFTPANASSARTMEFANPNPEPPSDAKPHAHSSAYGTSTSHTYGEGKSHINYYGGSTSHNYYGGTTHTNAYGGTTSGEYGYGAVHTNPYGATTYGSAYHPPTTYYPSHYYYGYHPPTTVNYYGVGCYNCSSGWATAGAAVAGMVTGAALASSASSTNSANSYAAKL